MKRPLPSLWPLLVGALSLAITLWLWSHEQKTEDARLKASFEFGLRQAISRIEQRMGSYEQMLRGVQGLMLGAEHVDQAHFNAYIDNLLSGTDAAGLQAFAYGPLLQAADLPEHLRSQQANGIASYALRPPGTRESYAPATFIAPAIGQNLSALGYDPLADPIRRAAMLRARDSGGIAITQKIRFFIDDARQTQAGFLMFLPLYAKGSSIDSAAARRANLVGWVWAAFRIDDMMSSLYGEGTPGLELNLHDGVGSSAESLMFRNGASPSNNTAPRFEAHEYIALPGHTWTLQVRALPEFEQFNNLGSASILAATGTGLSLMLALLTYQLVTGRSRAHATAQAMTRELRDSEARYRRIVETSQEGIWVIDAAARISFANPMMERMLGHPPGAIRGQPLSDFAGDDTERQRLERLLHQRVGHPEQHELKLRRADGSDLWVSMSVNPISDTGGVYAGALGMVTDISERKQAEARRGLLEAQLRESQKMEAIGTLAGGIAHDFNNILAVILGNVATARQDSNSGHSPRSSLNQIDKAAVRARSLVQQILAFSRMQPQALVSQPLRPLVEESITLLRSTLPAQVELQVDLAEAPLYAGADATQVQQVLMNLCTNAWHALKGSRGRITITLDAVDLDADTAQGLGVIQPGPCAHLSVSDTGCGMDEATRLRVFEPFFTTKRVGQGTGLGLSVVHGIVTAHQGAVRVESHPGRGSSFHIYLPLREPPVPSPEAAVPAPQAAPGQGEHVLYVDDDPAMLLMVEALLESAGYRVTAMGSPREALAAIESQLERYDVIVSDYNMPELTGVDIAQAVAQVSPRAPVLITSGYISDDLRAAAEQAGVRSLLQKEYTLEQLVELVHAALRGT